MNRRERRTKTRAVYELNLLFYLFNNSALSTGPQRPILVYKNYTLFIFFTQFTIFTLFFIKFFIMLKTFMPHSRTTGDSAKLSQKDDEGCRKISLTGPVVFQIVAAENPTVIS